MKYETASGYTITIKTDDCKHSFTAQCRDFEQLRLIEAILKFCNVKEIEDKSKLRTDASAPTFFPSFSYHPEVTTRMKKKR